MVGSGGTRVGPVSLSHWAAELLTGEYTAPLWYFPRGKDPDAGKD